MTFKGALRRSVDKGRVKKIRNSYKVWQYRLWSFQGRDTKLDRFLAKNQLFSNEITKFGGLQLWEKVQTFDF